MIERLHPIVLAKAQQLVTLAQAQGIPVRLIEGYRDPAKQAATYAAGTSNAPPGWSFHQYGLAFDAAPVAYLTLKNWNPSGPLWEQIGRIGESLGLTWGGRFTPTKALPDSDKPHFEYHPGFTIRDLVSGAKQVGQLLLERPAIPATAFLLAALGVAFLLMRRRV